MQRQRTNACVPVLEALVLIVSLCLFCSVTAQGTGHELHFLCLLSALGDCGLFDVSSALHCERVVGLVFCKYLSLMRHLQSRYWLEPAGSRGVWGLDDYSFLPFLLGSSQLIGHKYIKPKSVRYTEILDGFAAEFMYLDAIAFILQVKTCSFAEHSPMLNDITIIKTCQATERHNEQEASKCRRSSEPPRPLFSFRSFLSLCLCSCTAAQGTK